MAPVNQNWTSFQDIDPKSGYARRIRTVLQKANSNYLSKAVEIRKQEERQLRDTPTCFADTTKFTSGYCNLVVALTFSDSVQWVARIRLPQEPFDDPDMSISMLSEISTMNLIRVKTSIPVPCVFGYSENMKVDFGYPYVLMEALPGNILDRNQLATYIYELSTIRSNQIVRVLYTADSDQLEVLPFPIMHSQSPIGSLSTSLEYFYRLRKDQTKAILQGHRDFLHKRGEEEWKAAAWLLEKSLASIVTEENINGPFPLCHMDFHHGNVLVDEEYNITGILDWTNAQIAPIERFAMIPEFMVPRAAEATVKKALVEFLDMFIAALEKVEREETKTGTEKGTPLHSLFASPRSELVCRCTHSYPWRAIFDAQLALPPLYGEDPRWDDFQRFYDGRRV